MCDSHVGLNEYHNSATMLDSPVLHLQEEEEEEQI